MLKCNLIIIILIILLYITITAAQELQKTKPGDKSPDLAIGFVKTKTISNSFLNEGSFSNYSSSNRTAFSGITYKDITYLGDMDLWLGIPEGDWTPKIWDETKFDSVSLGPTVTGTFFGFYKFYRNGTDWGPVPGSRSQNFSGNLLLSDLYSVPGESDLPLLANSSFPLSWPENIYGDRVWPGVWSIDRETSLFSPGKFRADQEVYFEFTDIGYASNYYPMGIEYLNFLDKPMRGHDIGAKVTANILAFNDSYAQDFFFIDLKIMNVSQWNYHSAYLGLNFAPLVFREDIERKYYHDGNDNQYIGYLSNEYEQDTGQLYNYNLAYYFFDIDTSPFPDLLTRSCDYVGLKLLQTPFAFPNDEKDNDKDGLVDEAEEQLGLTGWHWFNTESISRFTYSPGRSHETVIDHPLKRGELVQYKVMSGDTTGLLPVEQERFFYPESGFLNPDFDNFGGEAIGTASLEFQMLLCSGPFNWQAGETVRFAFAVVFGKDLKELKSNSRVAQTIYDNNYQRMSPPPAPTVTAVAGDKQVTLYWDNGAEKEADFLTGYSDFEGYRLYRTTVNPALNQWGEQINDGQGKLVGFVPIAEFDLNDEIQGIDPQYPHLYLGGDTGIRHSWTDTTVLNGISYWYAVCAYDRGITPDSLLNPHGWPSFQSLENTRGTDHELYRNLVKITPTAPSSNYQSSDLSLSPLPGTVGNGVMNADIVDPLQITGSTYTVIFNDSTTGIVTYDVFNEQENSFTLQQVNQVNGEEGEMFDGIRLSVQKFNEVDFWENASGWIRYESGDSSVCNYSIKFIPLIANPPACDYLVRFTAKGDTGFILHKTAPFEIWNLTRNQQVAWEIFSNSPDDSTDSLKAVWSSGDAITFREEVDNSLELGWRLWLTKNPEIVYIKRDTIFEGYESIVYDTNYVDIAPKTGDAFQIVTTRPFRTGDRFCLQTKKVASHQITKNDLAQIKVVPNPYLVYADWEQHTEDHRLAFTHLPAKCQVIIFNVTGDVVAVLNHDNLYSGTSFWDLQSHEGMEVASGLYVYVVKTPEGKTRDGKFVVIR